MFVIFLGLEDEPKKVDANENQKEEENLLNERKQHELKFQIQQKQQLIQQQQAQAEAYNLAHPGQFQNIYQNVGTIHHVLQPDDYDDLMPDPLQYFTLMSGAPPPPPAPVPAPPAIADPNEPVLPPGRILAFDSNAKILIEHFFFVQVSTKKKQMRYKHMHHFLLKDHCQRIFKMHLALYLIKA